ncbi:zinc finger protein 2-like [Anthonomus grandis grandis]|uniref:zinc finger protein 2-like n=1 Tax=Anthonomus grandis grandis TaxID=2921223 RepID=UPI002165466B|nr:zinc finger protein 2-like [Anthonomus grandis grandis]
MEISKGKLKEMKLCRFCLSGDESKLSSIYRKEPKTVPLPIQIMSCLSIEVFAGDGLPELICEDCKKQTHKSYTFKANCKKSDEALKSYLITGKLVKPTLKKILVEQEPLKETVPSNTPARKPPPLTDMKTMLKRDAPAADPVQDPSDIKRMRLEDGTEVITLCISEEFQSQEETSQDSVAPKEPVGSSSLKFDISQEEEVFEHLPPAREEDEVEQIATAIFTCNICEKTFPLEQLLDLHLVNHVKERNFACNLCDLMFFSRSDMIKHQQVHADTKPFKCSVCDKEFAREGVLRRHEQTHPETPNYVCQECGKTFLQETDLERHMSKHEKSRPFECQECDKSFVFKQGLERHINSSHKEAQHYKCNYCEAGFSTLIRLTRHITHHAGLRPYPCRICGRTFLLSHHLTRHMKGHYGPQVDTLGRHRCDICSMSFKRMDSLLNHTAIHSMVNLKCVICDTSFETAQMVKEHITTHLHELPFPCEKCDYSFDTEKQLLAHEVKHAEMEYEDLIQKEVISEVKNHKCDNTCSQSSTEEKISKFNNKSPLEEYEMVLEQEQGGEVSTFHIVNNEGALNVEPKKELAQDPDHLFVNELEEEKPQEEPHNVINEDEDLTREDVIKPVYRTQGTKMYQRKGPVQRKVPRVEPKIQPVKTADLKEIDAKPGLGPITPDALSSLPSKKPVNVKVGDQVVKVQKFIISKEEMKQMAKMGILEVKNGQVIMKTPGQPIINAKIKPVQQSDIENLINGDKIKKTSPIKQYERKGGHRSSQGSTEAE